MANIAEEEISKQIDSIKEEWQVGITFPTPQRPTPPTPHSPPRCHLDVALFFSGRGVALLLPRSPPPHPRLPLSPRRLHSQRLTQCQVYASLMASMQCRQPTRKWPLLHPRVRSPRA